MTLANVLEAEKHYEESLILHQKATQIYQDFVTKDGSDRYDRAELARSLNNEGMLIALTGKIEEGRAFVERGRKLREELLADQPSNIEYRGDLARSYYHQARIHALAKEPAQAVASIQKAEELYKDVPPKGPEDIYFQACLKALRAGLPATGKSALDLPVDAKKRLADEAMELLKKAVAAGYRNATLFQNTESLKSLHDRPDFEELLRTIEPKGK
jgi:hypothetical protein